MILALDTNVLIDLWGNTAQGRVNAQVLTALSAGGCGAVQCTPNCMLNQG
ncbi:hypothetical protein [Deinococcus ruber]|uniref:PIN domain-containing protein n=1 Tax=Deinococcus ruber TaxID=1848197 RepID=A0A918CE91_9DEIO|nr:hypothetical protein [Deinococcus ruber]GGR19918.1 hypothetical protein GCM10008957_35380 [Deinococcus ruber]